MLMSRMIRSGMHSRTICIRIASIIRFADDFVVSRSNNMRMASLITGWSSIIKTVFMIIFHASANKAGTLAQKVRGKHELEGVQVYKQESS